MDAVGVEALTGAFVLPPSALLQEAEELPERVRHDIGMQDGEYALSRANSRTFSKVIDRDAAMLVREFETSTTIAHAVARFSRARNLDAEKLLEDALPMLLSLIASGLLIPADSATSSSSLILSIGTEVDGWCVVRSVQSLEDTELYQVRRAKGEFGALKIASSAGTLPDRAIRCEADIIDALDATVTPKLLQRGEFNLRPYFISEWFAGEESQSVCSGLRALGDRDSRREMLHVTGAILNAYARLHDQGVIHGDVQPRNILVDDRNNVKIVDFGLARRAGREAESEAVGRGGVSLFFEPELARATLDGSLTAPVTFTGEQYAVAAMLYLLVTGSPYLDFSFEKHEMMRQIAEAPMISFARRKIQAWPALEEVLRRALSKSPGDRFANMAEFAAAWNALIVVDEKSVDGAVPTSRLSAIQSNVLSDAALSNALFLSGPMLAPSTSLTYGSAGLAHTLYRIACATDDGELLAVADAWSQRAVREVEGPAAFFNEDIGITAKRVGSTSLYHGPAGVFATQALIARARGDFATQFQALRAFTEVGRKDCDLADLTLGYAGTLLGAAILLEACEDAAAPDSIASMNHELRNVGSRLLKRLSSYIDSCGPIGKSNEVTLLGVAHGWAGLLYAAFCWSVAASVPLAESLHERLVELASYAEPIGRGLQWKMAFAPDANDGQYYAGWCNGSAGYVFLWTIAYRATHDVRYLELAERAAWNAWERVSPNPTLCCGAAGQAYALLNYFRHSGDDVWLKRARHIASRAADAFSAQTAVPGPDSPELREASLYKGGAGIALLSAELERPEYARMPMFELEG